MLITFLYVILALYIVLNVEKLPNATTIETKQYDMQTPVIYTLPKGQIKDSHWFIKTFLRCRIK